MSTSTCNMNWTICALFVQLWFCFSVSHLHDVKYEDDECELENNVRGKCVRLPQCPSAIELINKREHPVICSFDGFTPIVCCPVAQTLKTRLSEQKCLLFRETEYEFLELIYQPGKEFFTLSVFGGEDAVTGEFPHMVALGFSKSKKEYDITWQCGGSLINEKFVLTAAHCLSSQDFGKLSWAHIGNKRLDVYGVLQNPGQLVYKIKRRIPYPMYKRPSTYHDIALVELNRPVVFHNEAKPACLPKIDTKPETNAVATGWGLTEDGITKQNLQKVTLDLFTEDECDQAYESLNNTRRLRNGIVHSNQFCAGGRSGIQDTCQGDSGGPFQFKISNYTGKIWHIHGITSFSKSCGLHGIPGVYTRVASYVPWIESVVWPDE